MTEEVKPFSKFNERLPLKPDPQRLHPTKPEMLWLVSELRTRQHFFVNELHEVIEQLTTDVTEKTVEWDQPVEGSHCSILQFAEAILHALEQVKMICAIADELLHVEKTAEHSSENILQMQRACI